ncbi:transmembrane protein, putative, partial [Bodo saltans]
MHDITKQIILPSMALNSDESKPLLVETASAEDVEKSQKAAALTIQLRRYRNVQAALATMVLGLIAGLSAAKLVLVHPDDYSSYQPSNTCLDIAIPVVLFELFVLYAAW